MDLANQTAHRALAYVAASQRQGYAMSVEEFEAYMSRPELRPGTPAVPDRVVKSTNVERFIRDVAQQNFEPMRRALEQSLGVEEVHVPGRPAVPGEAVIDWLTRLRWLSTADGRVRVTQLGDAMLAHLEQEKLEEDIPVGVVLNQGDELATARVIQRIAELGPCSLVDPYFSVNSLLQVLNSTEVEKVLTGSTAPAKVSGLEVGLDTIDAKRPFEIRQSPDFHDRFVIPEDGPLWLLGTSLTGLGNRLSVMVRIDDDTMNAAIRRAFDETWEAAEPVGPSFEATEANGQAPPTD